MKGVPVSRPRGKTTVREEPETRDCGGLDCDEAKVMVFFKMSVQSLEKNP